ERALGGLAEVRADDDPRRSFHVAKLGPPRDNLRRARVGSPSNGQPRETTPKKRRATSCDVARRLGVWRSAAGGCVSEDEDEQQHDPSKHHEPKSPAFSGVHHDSLRAARSAAPRSTGGLWRRTISTSQRPPRARSSNQV